MVTKSLMRWIASLAFVVMLPSASYAQGALSGATISNAEVVDLIDGMGSPLGSAHARQIADIASWGTVLTTLALDAHASKDHLVVMSARVGVTIGVTELVKRLVHRQRPCAPACGIDSPDSSFYSMHTALAFSTLGGPRLVFALPLSVGTGGLRVAAGKHYVTDVLVGAGVGALTSRIR